MNGRGSEKKDECTGNYILLSGNIRYDWLESVKRKGVYQWFYYAQERIMSVLRECVAKR